MTMLSTPSKVATVLSVREMPLMRSFLPDFKSSHPQPLSVAPNSLQIHSVFPYGEPLTYRKLGLQVSPRFYTTRDGRSVLKIRTRDFSSACEMQMPCSKGAEKSLGSSRMHWCLRFTGFRGGAFSFRALPEAFLAFRRMGHHPCPWTLCSFRAWGFQKLGSLFRGVHKKDSCISGYGRGGGSGELSK